MRRFNAPAVPGVFSPEQCRQTALSIAAEQESSGAIPWFHGGHTDPWDHVESAMALTAAGLLEPARAAYEWSRRTQRSDGSWPLQFRAGTIEDANSDSNFCAYIATGVWHYVSVTRDESFAASMWPTVHKAIDFVIDLQIGYGEICWARSGSGPVREALLTGCASVYHSIRCALALAALLDDPQPEWELALGRLGHALVAHPEAFTEKDRYSMDWYYPILGSALRGPAAVARIKQRWDDFVVDGLGIRCVADRPWVTGAETCELVMALEAIGQRSAAHKQFTAMQHLREEDGSYWTGLVFADGKRWPEERTAWTGAAVILAADALSDTTAGAGIFRAHGLPLGLQTDFDCECVVTGPGR
ncbi:prenyltransferase [Mycobacterium montefiorense]|uniref:Prenyltransferase n=1 Tax=Mycobacterium montefiorense TaxID=154654 RepID=A0AA37PK52_9MYCO|nr:prenyltransferase [Mycobacterium montefiorense]GBG39103.1 prenyltransferase [Mycobacterium montefiorense]GKU37423.1 prenyltransferase [Mycobacterium montefiorense]GKU42071.1 prenyltransferase [Mycobacterium montefiorense]GKU45466.1 prenyltransferase [Mycobacterium montefiorense]GKU53573.1 prenyltransferase [Mycobacterium montefiorense]